MFTMKHYKAIADMVGSQLVDNPLDSSAIIKDWCRMFEEDNPRFKSETFRLAVNHALEEALTNRRGY